MTIENENEATVQLPFTVDQFLEVFADYNRQFWMVALAWWLAVPPAIVLVWRRAERDRQGLSWFLGVLWLWNAVAYHALLFTRINPAAWLFAALFALQAALFFRTAARENLQYLSCSGWEGVTGALFVAYALAYPLLTIALGHEYPATPTFGVPCPTVILTIGLLLTCGGRTPRSVVVVPVLWSFVAGSAAILLAVPADYVLFAAGAALLLRELDRSDHQETPGGQVLRQPLRRRAL